jgi:hypothetical protein
MVCCKAIRAETSMQLIAFPIAAVSVALVYECRYASFLIRALASLVFVIAIALLHLLTQAGKQSSFCFACAGSGLFFSLEVSEHLVNDGYTRRQ